jgi:translation initiation factor IF-3
MKSDKFFRINDKIKISPIILIDDEGNNLGQIPLFKAKEMALNKSLDLVEVSANSRPPVCKIMDFGKFRYELEIKEKKQRQTKKQAQMKEIRLSCGIEEHDMETKAVHAIKFLQSGQKVQIRLEFRRRENNHKELGFTVINKFLLKVEEYGSSSKKPSIDGKFLSCLLEPKVK